LGPGETRIGTPMKKLRDHYFHKAKKEDYAARSVYKLKEMDERFRLLKRGGRVLDLGCAPGSWCQYASERVGPKGLVVGLDVKEVSARLGENVRVLQMDALLPDIDRLRSEAESFDAVLSDMAPSTTGIKSVDQVRSLALAEAALDIAAALLRPGGNFAVKVFQGKGFEELVRRMRTLFDRVRIAKPESSRKESKEIYAVGTGFKGRD
jgi:23S rRNA (uridine2552-2'-O)-methyltransferase